MSAESSLKLSEELKDVSGWGYDQVQGCSLGFLMRKLPLWSELEKTDAGYRAMIFWRGENIQFEANTPEDAACKLAIELFKAGVLKSPDGRRAA